jgi:hypothetical protein
MTRAPDDRFNDWKERAEVVGLLPAAKMFNAKLRRHGSEWVGPCRATAAGPTGSGSTPAKAKWNCRGFGGGSSTISIVMHMGNMAYKEAIELLTGEPCPQNGPAKPLSEEKLARATRLAGCQGAPSGPRRPSRRRIKTTREMRPPASGMQSQPDRRHRWPNNTSTAAASAVDVMRGSASCVSTRHLPYPKKAQPLPGNGLPCRRHGRRASAQGVAGLSAGRRAQGGRGLMPWSSSGLTGARRRGGAVIA